MGSRTVESKNQQRAYIADINLGHLCTDTSQKAKPDILVAHMLYNHLRYCNKNLSEEVNTSLKYYHNL